MPVPPSTLIFAIATAIPFGLAIKDTATGKYDFGNGSYGAFGSHGDDSDDDEGHADALERYGNEQQRLMEARVQARAARLEIEQADDNAALALRDLYGAEVASMGSLFEDVKLGAAKNTIDPTTLNKRGNDATLVDDGVTTHTLYLKISDADRPCSELRTSLREVWGIGAGEIAQKIWVNPVTHQRAVMESRTGCELRFEKIVTIDGWIDRRPTAVLSLDLIGKSVKSLVAQLGARANVDEDSISWVAPGVGVGSGTTRITATTAGGKVVGLFATVEVDEDTQQAVVDRITKLVGKPVDKPQSGTLSWKTSPAIQVELGSQMFVKIGQQGR